MPKEKINCEVLVIGSGPGGATTALVLAQAGRDVLVLEEGPAIQAPPTAYSLDEMKVLYRHGGLSVAWGNPKVSYLEGRCVGGASEINAGLYHRPLPQVLDRWARDFSIEDFDCEQLEPFFKANEVLLKINFMPNGVGVGSRVIQKGASQLGWKTAEIPRMWDYSSNGNGGQRRSMGQSFISSARAAKARFMAQMKVKQLVCRGQKAVEAWADCNNDVKTRVRVFFKDVFVCGGAIQTPLLLRKSGLVKNIGGRLRMHPAVRVVAQFQEQASDPDEGVPVVQVSEFKPYLTLGGSFSSPAYLALWLAGREDFTALMRAPHRLGIFYALVTAKGCGRIKPMPFKDEPMVSMHMEEEDLKGLGEGVYKLGQVLFAAGARTIYSPITGGRDYRSLADMEQLKKGLPRQGVDYSTMHLFSSCPMGENRSLCALDSFGRMHGMGNVYVNDASMLPEAPGANPQAVIMAIARRNAVHFLNQKETVHGQGKNKRTPIPSLAGN
jgi:choline dehydrogenase-like flavoprotein